MTAVYPDGSKKKASPLIAPEDVSRDHASLDSRRLRVAYISDLLTRGHKILGPERQALAKAWGVSSRRVNDYIYEAHRVAAISVPREVWSDKLTGLIEDACVSAQQIQKPDQKTHALVRVVEVAGRFTGSQAPERVQMEQVTVQVSAELTRYLTLLAQRLPVEAYEIALACARELAGDVG